MANTPFEPTDHGPARLGALAAVTTEALYRAWQTGAVLTAAQITAASRAALRDITSADTDATLTALHAVGVAERHAHGWTIAAAHWT